MTGCIVFAYKNTQLKMVVKTVCDSQTCNCCQNLLCPSFGEVATQGILKE